MTNTARSSDFLNTLGVDTHIPYTDGGYAKVDNIIADLKMLGIAHVRDGLSDGEFGSAPLSSYVKIAQAGVTFTVVIDSGRITTTADLTAQLSRIKRLIAAVPGAVTAIEGPNEINNWPVRYNGQTGLDGALALQRDIYAAVHADPALKGIPVDYLTGYASGGIGVGPNPSTTAGLADADTQHPYPNGEAPAAAMNPDRTLPNEPAGARGAFVYTETGYSSNGGTGGGVSADVQARYTLDLLLDAFKAGAGQTDLYELMDAYAAGSPQGNDGYGLFGFGNVAKPVAIGLHNLTAILADTGRDAASFATGTLSPTFSSLPPTGNSLVLQKSSGAFDVVVWAEPKIWDKATGTQRAAPNAPVTVDLGATFGTVAVYDPLLGSSAQQTLSGVHSLQVSVSDHPLVIEVARPIVAPTVALTGQTLDTDTGPSASDGVTSRGGVTLTGTVTGATGVAVTVYDGGAALGPATIDKGSWRFATTLTAGPHALSARATNPDGTTASTTAAPPITVITTPPTITLADPVVNGAAVMLSGTVTGAAGTTVTLFNGTAPLGAAVLDGKGRWSLPATLAPGSSRITAVATDLAGNTATTNAPVTVAPRTAPTADTLTLMLSEDAWKGDAQFSVTVDGKAVGGVQSVTALHRLGRSQAFTFSGSFGPGNHAVGVTFLNDAWGGTVTTDRNLYVDKVGMNGALTAVNRAQLSQGQVVYQVNNGVSPAAGGTTVLGAPAASQPGATGTLSLILSEDAWKGDAQFSVTVDGKQVGGVASVTALHRLGQSQAFTFSGAFGEGGHTVRVTFPNDAWAGTPDTDRNLHVDAIGWNGTTTRLDQAQNSAGTVFYRVGSGAAAVL